MLPTGNRKWQQRAAAIARFSTEKQGIGTTQKVDDLVEKN